MIEAADGDRDRLAELLDRRCNGEPLAWLIGSATFCGERVLVHPGVYVPRWQSEGLCGAALARLSTHGVAVDLCTGSGSIATVLSRRRPLARVVATDVDRRAATCARANGVAVVCCDMASGLSPRLAGRSDVVVAVVPYVPTAEMSSLPRDVVAFEPHHALDGGPDGLALVRRAVTEADWLLQPGGSLLLEVGGEQDRVLHPILVDRGYVDIEFAHDDEGDLRFVAARRPSSSSGG